LKDVKKVVLAYSGGLDTSVCLKWIQDKYNTKLVTVTVDVGQTKDFKEIADRAYALGVEAHYLIDGKQEFFDAYITPAIKANALYQGKYPLDAALSRPLIASRLVDIAHKVGADGVAHGCTGKGNDQVRFDVCISALDPKLKIIAPVREWDLDRVSEIDYAKKHGIPVNAHSIYSVDENMWGRSIECGILEYPDKEPPEDVFKLTTDPTKAPDEPQYVTVGFEEGVPVSLNDKNMSGVDLINKLNDIGGLHGVGRIDHIEDRLVGIKSREVYECPAATILLEAHTDLEKMVLTRHENYFKQLIDTKWTELVYTGLWMDPLKDALEAFIDITQKRVTGAVRVKLYKGNALVVGRNSPNSLYNYDLATYEELSTFDQKTAVNFIQLWGLPTVVARNSQLPRPEGRGLFKKTSL
jgi:argininosuccinate synthase